MTDISVDFRVCKNDLICSLCVDYVLLPADVSRYTQTLTQTQREIIEHEESEEGAGRDKDGPRP